MALSAYTKKRNLKKSGEPQGVTSSSTHTPIFVVQRHSASHLHYDFRLEMKGVLKSWAIPKGPSMHPRDKRLAVHVEDHPYAYRTFSGTIPKGQYGAGKVTIWDKGTYQLVAGSMRSGELVISLRGKKLKGQFALVRMKKTDNWLLVKKRDTFARI